MSSAPSSNIVTFRFPKPIFLTPKKTDQKVLLDWLCYLVGETLLDEIPLISISIEAGIHDENMSEELLLTLDDEDKDNISEIIQEINKHYDTIWNNEIFMSYNAANDRSLKYVYRITDNAIHFDLYSEPTSENVD